MHTVSQAWKVENFNQERGTVWRRLGALQEPLLKNAFQITELLR